MAGSVSIKNKVSSVSKSPSKQSRESAADRKSRRSKSSSTLRKSSNNNKSLTSQKKSSSATYNNNNNNNDNKENSKSISDEISRRSSNNNKSKITSRNSRKSENNEVKVPEECECGPDLYTPVLGPTVDETILTGLNTIMTLYNKLRDCGDKDNDEDDDEEQGKNIVESIEESIDETIEDDEDEEQQESREFLRNEEEDESITGDSAEVGIQEDLTPKKPPEDKRSSQTASTVSQSGRTQTRQFSTASFGVQVTPTTFTKIIDVRPSIISEGIQVSLVCPNLSIEMPEKSSIHQVLQTVNPSLRPAQTSTPRSSVMSLPQQTSRPNVSDVVNQTPTASMTNQGVVPDVKTSVPKSHQTPPKNVSEGKIQTVPSPIMSFSDTSSYTESVSKRLSDGVVQSEPPGRYSRSQQSIIKQPSIIEEDAAPTQKVRKVEAKIAPVRHESSTGSAKNDFKNSSSGTLPARVSSSSSQRGRRPSVTRGTSDVVMRDSDAGDKKEDGSDKGSETNKDRQDSSSQQHQSRESGGDEHSCISPPEPPKSCPCCKCTSSSSTSRTVSKKRSTNSRHHKAECVCRGSRTKLKCRCSTSRSLKKGESSSSKLGRGDSKDQPIDVKYAITKISKYEEFTTYEVMKSTHSVPKKMPRGVDGVFVLKKKNN